MYAREYTVHTCTYHVYINGVVSFHVYVVYVVYVYTLRITQQRLTGYRACIKITCYIYTHTTHIRVMCGVRNVVMLIYTVGYTYPACSY